MQLMVVIQFTQEEVTEVPKEREREGRFNCRRDKWHSVTVIKPHS